MRQVLREKYRYCCNPLCGRADSLEEHHIVPRSQGGSDEETNLVLLCAECHRRRHEERLEVSLIDDHKVKFLDKETGEIAIWERQPHVSQGLALAVFQEAQTIESWFDFKLFEERIRSLADEELDELYFTVKEIGRRVWMALCVIIGERQRRANYGERAVEAIAEQLGISRRTAFYRGKIYREILSGEESADIALSEEGWYWVAVDTDKPLYWLNFAAEKKSQDPRYSIRQFKRDILFSKFEGVKSLPALVTSVDIRIGDVLDLLPLIEDDSISLCIADPPYNVKDDVDWDFLGNRDEYLSWLSQWLAILKTKLAPEFHFFLFCAPEYQADIEILLRQQWEIKSRLIWHYKNLIQGRLTKDRFISSYQTIFHVGEGELHFPVDWGEERFDVQEFATPQTNFGDTKYHQRQKPLGLIKLLVELGSSPGELVLDLFAGSGTTSVAAITSGRRALAIEKDEQWRKVITERCATRF